MTHEIFQENGSELTDRQRPRMPVIKTDSIPKS